MLPQARTAQIFVVSAPSGVGKTTLVQSVLSERPGLKFSVSCTTRLPRPGEIDGLSYHFLSREEFLRDIPDGRFVEWAEVHGEYYGTDRDQLERWLSEEHDVLLDIDVQGARRIRCAYPAARTIFILPPSLEVLAERLRNRGTESPEQLTVRLAAAHREMQEAPWYDFIIVNDVLEEAIADLKGTLRACRCATSVQSPRWRPLLFPDAPASSRSPLPDSRP